MVKAASTVIKLSAPATAVSVSPNGLRIAAAMSEGDAHQVRILDLATGKELQRLLPHSAAVRSLAFLPDNRTLVSVSADKSAKLSDVAVGLVVDAHPGGASAVAYHSNGTQLLTGGADKTAKLWDAATGKVVRTFGPLPDPVTAVAFSRDFARVGVAAGKVVKTWNLADGKELLALSHPAAVTGLSFSQDNGKIATSAADNTVRIWDAASGRELQWFPHTGPATAVAFHQNNVNVVSGSADKTVQVHTLAATRAVSLGTPIRGLTLTPNASHVLAAGDDKIVRLVNLGNGKVDRTLTGAGGAVRAVAVSKNNVLVAAGGADQKVRLYTLGDGKEIKTLSIGGPVRGLTFSPNNLSLAVACDNGVVTAFNVAFNPGQPTPPAFGQSLQSFTHPDGALDVVFAADNATFYTAGGDKTIKTWRLAASAPTKNFGHPNMVGSVAFSPTSPTPMLATACADGKVRLFDVAKGQQVREINAHVQPMPSAVYAVAWSPDGKFIVSGSLDKSLKLWDASNGNLVREFKAYKAKEFEKGHRGAVFAVAFSPDGKTLASAGDDRTIKLWNVADGTVLREFVNTAFKLPAPPVLPPPPAAHPNAVYALRFTPDGKHLISAGGAARDRGYLAIWDVADGKLVRADELPVGAIWALAVSRDGKLLALGTTQATGPPRNKVNTSYVIKMPDGK